MYITSDGVAKVFKPRSPQMATLNANYIARRPKSTPRHPG
jgi:hypothetical protein